MIYIAYRTVCNQRNKGKTDILDLVSEYVKLEKEDAITLVCVLFMMKTPSFTVSEDKQICHCFGCKKVEMFFNLFKTLRTFHS